MRSDCFLILICPEAADGIDKVALQASPCACAQRSYRRVCACVDGKHWSIGNGLFRVFSPLEATVDLFMKCSRDATRRCTVDVVSLVYVSYDLCALYTVPRISICPPYLIS